MTPSRTFRISSCRSSQNLALLAMLVAPILMVGISFAQFTDRAWERLSARPEVLLMLAAFPFAIGFSWWAKRRYIARARLTIDDRGISFDSGLPGWMGGARRILWSEVRKVTVVESLSMVQVRKTRLGKPLPLRMLMWVPEDRPDEPMPKAGFLKRPDIRATTLWKTLEARGLFAEERKDPRLEAVNFDLARHPATRAALYVMGALTAYWAVDCYVGREAWAEWELRYLVAPMALGLSGAIVAFAAMRASPVRPAAPPQILGAMAAFVGMCVGLASWPGLVRVNQWLGGPLEPHAYVRNASCDTLLPVEAGLPPIEYTGQAKAYWCSLPKDQQHTVLVRKGLGGLYQVDLTEQTQAIRRYRAQTGL